MTNEISFPCAIDNTMRKELVKCQMAAHYRFEMGLSDGKDKVDLHAGGAFAAGLEAMRKAFYTQGKSQSDALVVGVEALYKAYGNFVCPADSNKSADRMAGALTFYMQEKPMEGDPLTPLVLPNGEVGIEMSFNYEIPVEHPYNERFLTYCGRYDVLAIDDKRRVWICDEKTTKQLGDKWPNQWALDGGLTGYCWGAKKLLEEHGLDYEVAGAVINGIAIKLRDYAYMRVDTYRQDWQIQKWYEQMLTDVRTWKSAYIAQKHNQTLDHTCAYYMNPCMYAPLCLSANPERLVEGSYVVKFWNPLTRS